MPPQSHQHPPPVAVNRAMHIRVEHRHLLAVGRLRRGLNQRVGVGIAERAAAFVKAVGFRGHNQEKTARVEVMAAASWMGYFSGSFRCSACFSSLMRSMIDTSTRL